MFMTRDVKSDQILLIGERAKLSGFGFSADIQAEKRRSLVNIFLSHPFHYFKMNKRQNIQ